MQCRYASGLISTGNVIWTSYWYCHFENTCIRILAVCTSYLSWNSKSHKTISRNKIVLTVLSVTVKQAVFDVIFISIMSSSDLDQDGNNMVLICASILW